MPIGEAVSAARRVLVPLTTRGNYAKMKSAFRAAARGGVVEMLVAPGGGIVRERFGDFRERLVADGFTIAGELDFLVEDGATPDAQARSSAKAIEAFTRLRADLKPDSVLLIADRYETLAFAAAATCLALPIVHLEGGEVSGSIDERIRHAVTKLAHYHLPANDDAKERILRMGEPADRVRVVGSPSLDLIADLDLTDRRLIAAGGAGEGDRIDFHAPYVVVSQHPVVGEHAAAAAQIAETLAAVDALGLPAAILLPNMDAGGVAIVAEIARWRGRARVPARVWPSMPMESYAALLTNASCLVGNTSSGLRESAFLGVPVVNIGSRQTGRARGANVADVPPTRDAVLAAARRQASRGRYPRDTLYGDGRAGEKIAEALRVMPLHLDKPIVY